MLILGVVCLDCQYHSQLIGWHIFYIIFRVMGFRPANFRFFRFFDLELGQSTERQIPAIISQ